MERNVGEVRPTLDPDADDAECGCGAIGVARHTNAQHYGTRAKAEAEARDATGLDEALYELLAAIGVAKRITETIMPEAMPCGHDRRWVLSLFEDIIEGRDAVRAALAAAPPEPHWPSERDERAVDELNAVLRAFGLRTDDVVHPQNRRRGGFAILAALREGAERP